MHEEVLDYLKHLSDHPEGDREAWRARYAPLIHEVRDYHARPEPLLSVVVVAWRATDGLSQCLAHLAASRGIARHRVQVVLVDNAGLRPLHATLPARGVDRHILMHVNVGLSPARNAGVAWSDAPIIVFLDDDGLIAPDYLARGMRYFERDPHIMAIRSRIVAKHHPYFTTLAGHYDRGTAPVEDCLVTEGSMMIRRDAYMEVGGFADHLYGHEGIELTYQLKQRDPRSSVLYAPDVVMAHDYIHTWQKFLEKNTRYAVITDDRRSRPPDVQRFMDAHFAQRFERSPLPLDQRVARKALGSLRRALQLGVKLRTRVQQQQSPPGGGER